MTQHRQERPPKRGDNVAKKFLNFKRLFIFYEVKRGVGLVGFEGGHAKKYGFKGGARQKIWCVKGGHQKKLPLSLVVTASVIMQKSVPECQKQAFLRLATLPHQLFGYQIQTRKCQLFLGLCWSILKRLNI